MWRLECKQKRLLLRLRLVPDAGATASFSNLPEKWCWRSLYRHESVNTASNKLDLPEKWRWRSLHRHESVNTASNKLDLPEKWCWRSLYRHESVNTASNKLDLPEKWCWRYLHRNETVKSAGPKQKHHINQAETPHKPRKMPHQDSNILVRQPLYIFTSKSVQTHLPQS